MRVTWSQPVAEVVVSSLSDDCTSLESQAS